ncbi:hypothetical protein CDAR_310611 [Caerostris darwini]|uniref:Uncharacterized protein n=1 Tax=Caerostris darwini TaxID=1538125 RepID=A0AAV4WT49_9ARAC|nr:hypothetical protein CDAR_310611 [Caerostris darwini]
MDTVSHYILWQIADLLAKEGISDVTISNDVLTFSEICSKIKPQTSSYGKLLQLIPGITGRLLVVPLTSRLVESSRPPIVEMPMDTLSVLFCYKWQKPFRLVSTVAQDRSLPNNC